MTPSPGVSNIQYTPRSSATACRALSVSMTRPCTVVPRCTTFRPISAATGNGTTGNAYAGVRAPDVVGNIRVDQAWGLFQISAAAHLVDASYNALTAGTAQPTALSEISEHPEDKWGGSVMAALNIKNLPTGAGDDIKIDASYAKGDSQERDLHLRGFAELCDVWRQQPSGRLPELRVRSDDGRGLPPGDRRRHRRHQADGSLWCPLARSTTTGIRTGRAACSAAIRPCDIMAPSVTSRAPRASIVPSTPPAPARSPADYSCNPDFNIAQLGFVTRWTPVKNLTFSGEVLWVHLDQKFTGAATLAASAPKPTTVYEYRDQDAVSLQLSRPAQLLTAFPKTVSASTASGDAPPEAFLCISSITKPQAFAGFERNGALAGYPIHFQKGSIWGAAMMQAGVDDHGIK